MFDTPYSIAQFIIGIFGTITTITCFLPQGIKTFFSLDTSGLSKWFFISAIASSIFWLAIGSMTIASPAYFDSGDWSSAISSGLPPIITNLITIVINSIVLFIKLRNIKNAKKMKLTENEYCNLIKKEKYNKL